MAKKANVKAMLANAKLNAISGGDGFRFTKKGQVLEGIYRGQGKTTYDEKDVIIHKIENVDNEVIGIWESKALEVLRTVKKGAIVRIEFLGEKKGKRGRTFKMFDIQASETE